MRNTMVLIVVALVALTGIFLVGCSESTSPSTSTSTSSVDVTTALNQSIASSEMTLLYAGGVKVEGKGMLMIGWREMFNPCSDSAITVGRAFAVGFDSAGGNSLRKDGIDMGVVSVHYDSTNSQLTKHTTEKGSIFYSSSLGPRISSTAIPFIGDEQYDFTISGSPQFSALTAGITTPSALINLTSPQKKDTVDKANDLTITWTGGGDSAGVVIAIAALPHLYFEGDDDHDGEHHDGGNGNGDDQGENGGAAGSVFGGMKGTDHHHDGGGDGWKIKMPPGGFPPVLDSTKSIIVKLATNPGSYTVSASALQNLLTKTGARHLSCSVSQLIQNNVTHDGGTVFVVIRNSDGTIVVVK